MTLIVTVEIHNAKMSALEMASIFLFPKILNMDLAGTSLNIADFRMGSLKLLFMLQCNLYEMLILLLSSM